MNNSRKRVGVLYGVVIYLCNFYFLHPIHFSSHYCHALNSDPGSSSPLPTTVRAFIHIVRNSQHFSLVDSRRIVPADAARRSQQLVDPFVFFHF